MSKARVALRRFVRTAAVAAAAASAVVVIEAGAGAQTVEQPVQAMGRLYPLTYSPGLLASIESLADGGKALEPEGPCLEQEIGAAPGKLLPHDFSHARGRLATLEREAGEPLSYRTWGTIDIKNNGSKPLISAAVELPFAGEFAVAVAGQTILGKFERSIPLGAISPAASVNVRFWTGSTPNLAVLKNDARVTFQDGAAPIAVVAESAETAPATTHTSPAWVWVHTLVLLVILLGIVAVLMRLRRLEGR